MRTLAILAASAAVFSFVVGDVAFAANPAKDACNNQYKASKARDKSDTSSEKAETASQFQAENAACYEAHSELVQGCGSQSNAATSECIKELDQELKTCLGGAKAADKTRKAADKQESKASKKATQELKQECLNGVNL